MNVARGSGRKKMNKTANCPTCKTKNQIDHELLFNNVFEWFICSKCDDVWVKSQYGDWLESNPYQEYVAKLKPGLYGKKKVCFLLSFFTEFLR